MTKLKIFCCGIIILVILAFLAAFLFIFPPPITGQTPPTNCGGGTPARAEGLITTSSLQGKFGTLGRCVIDPKTAFVPYKIPTYDDLKSLYFTQAKPPIRKDSVVGSPNQGQFTSVFTQNDAVLVNGDLPNVDYTGTTKPSTIFVEGNLSINNNLTYGDTNSGIIFIVKGNVNIDQAVTRIDAVIISAGQIYTAGSGCSRNSVTANQLIVNGSLVSLDENKKIEFCRTLSGAGNNTTPAEKIIHQPKYPVILRNLFSDTLQKWSEVQ